MKSTEKQELKRTIKRLALFFVIVFLPVFVISVILWLYNVSFWLNLTVLVIVLFIFYGLYAFICGKLDKKKTERMKKRKDPFSD